VTLCSSESRSWAIDLSRPTLGRAERFFGAALSAAAFFGAALAFGAFLAPAFFPVCFLFGFGFALAFFALDFLAAAFFGFSSAINAPSFGHGCRVRDFYPCAEYLNLRGPAGPLLRSAPRPGRDRRGAGPCRRGWGRAARGATGRGGGSS